MIYNDYIRVLYIDLTTEKVRIENRKDLTSYLGGVGVASKLLLENMKPGVDPLHPDQPIIFAIGALTTVFPVITKTVAMFISPLTGELGESYAGGRLAMTLMLAGYDALVITGKGVKPRYLSISRNDIKFIDARALWGVNADETGSKIREREPGGGKRSIIRIGPGGENQVKYAAVCVDTYRHFGRLGLGGVFGSKNLKAISVIGDRSIPVKNFKEYFKVFQDIYKKVTTTEVMSKYHDLGTAINIKPLNAKGGLPTKNLKQTVFEHGDSISGESFAEKNLVRKQACTGCPVGCIHIGQFRREFDKGYEYEAISVSYDYELIFSLGTYLGVKTTDEVLELIEAVEEMGLDAMSAGVCLGWMTEAFSKNLITIEQTIVPVAFGDTKNYLIAIKNIAHRVNEFYKYLGDGVEAVAQKYGGSEFANHFAKNEMAGYHTGYGSVVGSIVGSRHSHLCNGGYSVDQSMKTFDKNKMVESLFDEEKERCMLNSLIICLFARKVYDRETILAALNSVGYTYTNEDLDAIAEKIFKTKMEIKKLCGFKLSDVKVPKRFFETPAMNGILEESVVTEMVKLYQGKIDEMMAKE